MKPELSVVIPVYNEEESLQTLFTRLVQSLDALKRSYEIVLVNDGSQDRSFQLLSEFHQQYPDRVQVIDFHGNFGQHMAIMAGFERARGDIIITMDADLQNPPEEIWKLLEKYDAGSDYVGSYRHQRQDNWFRTYGSRLVNWFRDSITQIRVRDQGCMLRAYSRRIIDLITASQERSTFITALAYQYSLNPTEVEVKHEARLQGESKYDIYRLIRVTFDLITGFSLVPLQIFTLTGMASSFLTFLLVLYMGFRRLVFGAEVEGVFTLFAILFFLMSVLIMGVGLLGEYLGRVSQAVSKRPRYMIRQVLEVKDEGSNPKILLTGTTIS